MKPMSAHASEVYRKMIAAAYSRRRMKPYTAAELLISIQHDLTTNEKRRLGRKFCAYVKKHPHSFKIIGQNNSGNNIYQTG